MMFPKSSIFRSFRPRKHDEWLKLPAQMNCSGDKRHLAPASIELLSDFCCYAKPERHQSIMRTGLLTSLLLAFSVHALAWQHIRTDTIPSKKDLVPFTINMPK